MDSYKKSIHHSKWNLRPDADITNQAQALLQPFTAEFYHMKSHQDDKTDLHELPFAAELNVLANAQAIRQHEKMVAPLTMV
jgi:hypothetical protein